MRREQPPALPSEQHSSLPRRESNGPRREQPWHDLPREQPDDLPREQTDDLPREQAGDLPREQTKDLSRGHPDTQLHEQHDKLLDEEHVGQSYEQPGETSTQASDEEQDDLPPELKLFVTSTGYLDHGRITQPLHAECIVAGCAGTAARLLELVTHMMTPWDIVCWPGAPTGTPFGRKDKLPCTATLLDRAVCPFATSNGSCAILDWAAFREVVRDYVVRIAAGEQVMSLYRKVKKRTDRFERTQLLSLRKFIDRIVAINFVLHNVQKSPGLRCGCGFVFRSAVSAALPVSAGCNSEGIVS